MRELDSITDQQVHGWRQDGVVLLRGIIKTSWLEVLRDGIEHCIANPSPAARDYAEIGKGRFLPIIICFVA